MNGWRGMAAFAVLLAIAGLVLAGTWRLTRQDIAANDARRVREQIATVLPAAGWDNEPERDVAWLDTGSGERLPVYRARRGGRPVAAALTVVAPGGYGGPLRLLVGVGVDGRVTGVRVLAHAETPGIGGDVAADDSRLLRNFDDRSDRDPPRDRWALQADGGDFDAVAGATVSSRALVAGVAGAVRYVADHEAEVFGRGAGPEARP